MNFYNANRSNAILSITRRREATAFPQRAGNQASLGMDHTEIYGCNVFDDNTMRCHLPKAIYQSLRKTMDRGESLDPSVADIVASAMKNWAMSRGATHYTHVFYPLTGLTAEKHDSFLTPDGSGGALAEFSGNMLAKGEADGSSLPSGGLRSTFEARGYTAWDVTSPAYLMDSAGGTVLCIPTVFLSWTGLALDTKTPLLRANQALSRQAKRILSLFGVETPLPIVSNSGLEQEYFLIDENFAFARPDLLISGRTLLGARPPKGQEFDDQYYGVIPDRVLAFMMDAEEELCRLGVPVKTRHNEAAPSQYEVAPMYETANLATDHNQLIMIVLRKTAKKHGLICLLHEKPFAGINGSGKHINYSIGNADLGNLFDPGDTPHDNAQFLVFLCAVIRGMHKYAGFLRATVASASNDLRLGANEAPPAIMSLFLGDQLTDVLEQFRAGKIKDPGKKRIMNVGVDTLPPLPADPGDRNRTSPFTFGGNRFEFRALGSSQSAAETIMALNVMMAESCDFAASFLERQLLQGSQLGQAVQLLIEEVMEEHSAVIFNGDGYSDIWHREAARRGLPNYPTTAEAMVEYTSPEVVDLCDRYKVFSRQELKARQDIRLEQYIKTVHTEANIVLHAARTMIYPAASRYRLELANSLTVSKAAGFAASDKVLREVSAALAKLEEAVEQLEAKINAPVWNEHEAYMEQAVYCRDAVIPQMAEIRIWSDTLETLVADDLWPLPSYQEMLFMK